MRISDWSSDVCSSDLQRLKRTVLKRRRKVSCSSSTGEDDDPQCHSFPPPTPIRRQPADPHSPFLLDPSRTSIRKRDAGQARRVLEPPGALNRGVSVKWDQAGNRPPSRADPNADRRWSALATSRPRTEAPREGQGGGSTGR